MLIPLNADAAPGLVPDVVKTSHIYGWYLVAILLSCLSLGEIVSGDAFAGMIFAIMTGIVVYMLQDGCKNMTMYCLFMLGMMSVFQCFFDVLGLLSSLGGRETTQSTVHGNDEDVTVVTRITMHPFFDQKMGEEYNLQSALMLMSPAIMAMCSTMCSLASVRIVGTLSLLRFGSVWSGTLDILSYISFIRYIVNLTTSPGCLLQSHSSFVCRFPPPLK